MPPFDYRRRATRNAYGYWVVGRSKSDAAATSEAAAARLAARTRLGAAAGSSSSASNSSISASISASSSSISPAAKKALEDFYAPWQHKSAAAHRRTPPHTTAHHRTLHTARRPPAARRRLLPARRPLRPAQRAPICPHTPSGRAPRCAGCLRSYARTTSACCPSEPSWSLGRRQAPGSLPPRSCTASGWAVAGRAAVVAMTTTTTTTTIAATRVRAGVRLRGRSNRGNTRAGGALIEATTSCGVVQA